MQQTCSRCGGLLVPGASACAYCGTPVSSNASPQQGSVPSTWQTNQTLQPGPRSSSPIKPSSSGSAPTRRKRSPALLISAIALVLVLGISLGAAGFLLLKNGQQTGPTTHTNATATPTPSGIPSLYQASLTRDPGSWQCTTATTCLFSKDGYHITGIKKGFVSDSLLIKQAFGDTVIEVKGIIAQGDPQNAGIGIEFRVPQDSEDAGYGFVVYDDGTYDVQKWDAQGTSSDLVGTTPSSIIPRGLNQLNDLKIVIKGTQFTFYDNGQQVATASDSTYTSGYIGLAAAEQGTEAVFSDLLITNP